MRLELDGQHPAVAPKGFFETKIFHPNVSATGEICVNVLKRDWKPDMGVRHILMVIRCLLIEPNPDRRDASSASIVASREMARVPHQPPTADVSPQCIE